MVPAGDDTWSTLTDNGYGARENSADYQLAVYRIDPRFGESTPEVLSATVLRDPDGHVPWQIVCDQTGDPLPDLSINVLPSEPPDACGTDSRRASSPASTSIPSRSSSRRMGRSGSARSSDRPCSTSTPPAGCWNHPSRPRASRRPRTRRSTSPAGEQPNVATSRGFEGLAISPDRRTLYPLLEGAVGSDHPQDVLMLTFDIRRRRFRDDVRRIRLEMPGAKVNLTVLFRTNGERAYPNVGASVTRAPDARQLRTTPRPTGRSPSSSSTRSEPQSAAHDRADSRPSRRLRRRRRGVSGTARPVARLVRDPRSSRRLRPLRGHPPVDHRVRRRRRHRHHDRQAPQRLRRRGLPDGRQPDLPPARRRSSDAPAPRARPRCRAGSSSSRSRR